MRTRVRGHSLVRLDKIHPSSPSCLLQRCKRSFATCVPLTRKDTKYRRSEASSGSKHTEEGRRSHERSARRGRCCGSLGGSFEPPQSSSCQLIPPLSAPGRVTISVTTSLPPSHPSTRTTSLHDAGWIVRLQD